MAVVPAPTSALMNAGPNNAAATLTRSGNHALTLTTSNTTSVTLPTTGTLATLDGTETFTNKTLTSPKINENVALTTTATIYFRVAAGTTYPTTSPVIGQDASGIGELAELDDCGVIIAYLQGQPPPSVYDLPPPALPEVIGY